MTQTNVGASHQPAEFCVGSFECHILETNDTIIFFILVTDLSIEGVGDSKDRDTSGGTVSESLHHICVLLREGAVGRGGERVGVRGEVDS